MAELVLKIGDGANYTDGDIIEAFNNRRIHQVHAEHICHPWKDTVNADGLLNIGSVVQDYYENTHQYRFEHRNGSLIRVTIAIGLEEDVTDNTDINEYLKRRKARKAPNGAPKKAIFGTNGAEVWYGGQKDFSNTKIDNIWNKIEEKTNNLKADHNKMTLGTLDLKHHLTLPVEDFDDITARDLVAPARDLTAPVRDLTGVDDEGNPTYVTRAKRKKYVVWRDLFPMDIPPTTKASDVADRSKSVDVRDRSAGPLSLLIALNKTI